MTAPLLPAKRREGRPIFDEGEGEGEGAAEGRGETEGARSGAAPFLGASASLSSSQRLIDAALAADPAVFDFDEAHREGDRGGRGAPVRGAKAASHPPSLTPSSSSLSLSAPPVPSIPSSAVPVVSRYIGGLQRASEARQREREVQQRRVEVREREREEQLTGASTERFVTAAYKQRLQQQQQWERVEEEKRGREEREDARAGPSSLQLRHLSGTGHLIAGLHQRGDQPSVQGRWGKRSRSSEASESKREEVGREEGERKRAEQSGRPVGASDGERSEADGFAARKVERPKRPLHSPLPSPSSSAVDERGESITAALSGAPARNAASPLTVTSPLSSSPSSVSASSPSSSRRDAARGRFLLRRQQQMSSPNQRLGSPAVASHPP